MNSDAARRHHGFRFGNFIVDLDRGSLFEGEVPVSLRPQSFLVLCFLLERAGSLVTKQQLIDAIWPDVAVTDDSLTHCLIDIRKAIGDHRRTLIRTIPRRGFIFDIPVDVWHSKSGERAQHRSSASASLAAVIVMALFGGYLLIALNMSDDPAGSEFAGIDPAAVEHYEQGYFLQTRRVANDLAAARERYFDAIELEPEFAAAWAGLAATYGLEYVTSGDNELLLRLKHAAEKATHFDPTLAAGWMRLAIYYDYIGDQEKSLRYFEHALEVDPDDPLVNGVYSGMLMRLDEVDRAIALQRRVVAIEPLNVVARGNLAGYLFRAGDYEGAIEEQRRALQLRSPDGRSDDQTLTVFAMIALARYADALEEMTEWSDGYNKHAATAMIALRTGDMDRGNAALRSLIQAQDFRAYFLLAEIQAFCEDIEAAFFWLTRMREQLRLDAPTRAQYDHQLSLVFFSPFLTPVREDPRWESWYREAAVVARSTQTDSSAQY